MDIHKFYNSKAFPITLYVIGAVLVLLLVFRAGVDVGFDQGAYSHRNFAEHGRMMSLGFAGELPQTHGGWAR